MRTLTRRLAGVALGLGMLAGSFVATAPNAEASTACATQIFSYSLTTKSCVKTLQKMVNYAYALDAKRENYLGGKRTLDPDGKYGTQTRDAVRNLQRHLQLYKASGFTPATVDGITGSQTWYYLCEITEYPQPALYTSAGCDDLNTSWLLAELWKAAHS